MIRRSAWAEVSSEGIGNNLKVIRDQIGSGVKICAVLKADAYGHGLSGFVETLSKRGYTDIVAVGKFRELIKVFTDTDLSTTDVLLLGAASAEEIALALDKGKIVPRRSIFSVYSIAMLNRLDEVAAAAKVTLRVHIRIDIWNSGMGISTEDFINKQDMIMAMPHLEVCGLYSHLYTAYSDDHEQIGRELEEFDGMVKMIDKAYRKRLCIHVLNSPLIFLFPQYAYDMVRAGTALYGLQCNDEGKLKPLLKVCSRIFDISEVEGSIPLSYINRSDDRNGKRRIARVMLGYWDMPLLLTQKDVRIWIKGKLYRPADELCMDNMCVDVTDDEDIKVGDLVVILGEKGVEVADIMERNGIGVIHSEWLCMTADRLDKVYI